MASKRKFDALEPGHQATIREAATALSQTWRDRTVQLTDDATNFVKGKGLKIVTVDEDAYRKATHPVYDEFRTTIGAEFVDSVLQQVANG